MELFEKIKSKKGKIDKLLENLNRNISLAYIIFVFINLLEISSKL
jgi:hypothetical protein